MRRYNNSSANEESQALVYAKDYVKSLHQNTRSALLYGKNNVVVQPVMLFISVDIFEIGYDNRDDKGE